MSDKRRLEQYFISGNKECVKFGRDFRADADPLLTPLQCSMGWRLELVNVVDSMAGHITITKWVVESKVTMAKRLAVLPGAALPRSG